MEETVRREAIGDNDIRNSPSIDDLYRSSTRIKRQGTALKRRLLNTSNKIRREEGLSDDVILKDIRQGRDVSEERIEGAGR